MPPQSSVVSSAAMAAAPVEIELKLALSSQDAARVGTLLLLKRRTPQQLKLHNIYFDTPDQQLRAHGIALRLRRDGRRWLQTLKTAGSGNGALTTRGEWEHVVKGPQLNAQALAATPWAQLDEEGKLFSALRPQFTTEFARTLWMVRRANQSVVEVALDIGQVRTDEHTAPICEIELELKRGAPADLFEVAAQLAAHVALLPSHMSKAQRGYAVLQGEVNAPVFAQAQQLSDDLPLHEAARRVLGAAFTQFCANLIALRSADDPELVHQARVGWRRWRSALKLFGPALQADAPPPVNGLRALLVPLARLRDLDVAATEILPRWQNAFVQRSAQRRDQWERLQEALLESRIAARVAVGGALQRPEVGATLIALTQWLETPSATAAEATPLDAFAQRRVQRLRKRMQQALAQAGDLEAEHQARILAKRTRYGVEALANVLPKEKAKRWRKQASAVQTRLGATRDAAQAASLVHVLGAAPELEAFLRGVAAGQGLNALQ